MINFGRSRSSGGVSRNPSGFGLFIEEVFFVKIYIPQIFLNFAKFIFEILFMRIEMRDQCYSLSFVNAMLLNPQVGMARSRMLAHLFRENSFPRVELAPNHCKIYQKQ